MPRLRLSRAEVRDWAFLVVGLWGIIYEAVFYPGPPRWPLLVVYLALLGLPGALGLDAVKERFTGGDSEEPKP